MSSAALKDAGKPAFEEAIDHPVAKVLLQV